MVSDPFNFPVSSDKDVACVGDDIVFTATTDPPGKSDCVNWSGGGYPASDSGTSIFTTYFDAGGEETVTASIDSTNGCTSSEGKQVTITFACWWTEVQAGAWELYFEVPGSCRDTCLCTDKSAFTDECYNKLSIQCCQSDGTGGFGGVGYHYVYTPDGGSEKCIGRCIWTTAENEWYLRLAEIGCTGAEVIYQTNHATFDFPTNEGCANYSCVRIVEYNCQTSSFIYKGMRKFGGGYGSPVHGSDGVSCPGHYGYPSIGGLACGGCE